MPIGLGQALAKHWFDQVEHGLDGLKFEDEYISE